MKKTRIAKSKNRKTRQQTPQGRKVRKPKRKSRSTLADSLRSGAHLANGRGDMPNPLGEMWPRIRGTLREHFTFTTIKDIVGVSGLPVDRLAGIQQKPSSGAVGATKGQLIEGIERLLSELDPQQRSQFVSECIEEMARRREPAADELTKQLRPFGWDLDGGKLRAIAGGGLHHPPPPPMPANVSEPSPVQRQEDAAEKKLTPSVPMATSPFQVLNVALSKFPRLKVFFGVVAGLAIVAMARMWSVDRGWTIVGGIAVVFFALLLLAVASLTSKKSHHVSNAGIFLIWSCVGMFVIWAVLLTTCVFFGWPLSAQDLPLSPKRQASERGGISTRAPRTGRHLTQGDMDAIARDFRAGYHVDFAKVMPDSLPGDDLHVAHVIFRVTSPDDDTVRLSRQILSVLTNGGFRVNIITGELPDPEHEGVSILYPLDYEKSPEFQAGIKRLFQSIGQPPDISVGTNAVGVWLGTEARAIFVKVGKAALK